jgi:superfamily II RNA helicase
LDQEIKDTEEIIQTRIKLSDCQISIRDVLGLERLVSARSRLQERKPQSRAEMLLRWLDDVVRPGRIVGIGRSGKRLVMVTNRFNGNVQGVREDGRGASFPLESIGRVYSPVYSLRDDSIEQAFEQIQTNGRNLVLNEPRLRDANTQDAEALSVLDDAIDSFTSVASNNGETQKCRDTLWSLLTEAESIERSIQQKDRLQAEVWQPFDQRARVLSAFGYLEYEKEKVTERGRWLADLRIDRPLVVGEALESGLFKTLDVVRIGAVMAALTADEERDYGDLELEDSLIGSLTQFEEVGFRVSSEEWKYGIEPAPELNFSAAGALARWASGADWASVVRLTKAEEGDLFRMFSRTGEALLQIAGLRRAHPDAASIAAAAAEKILREPVR